MRHVCPDQMASCKSRTERKLASQHGGTDDTGQSACVVARDGGMRAAHSEHVKHCTLWLKDSATTESADLNRGHGDGDLE